MVLNLDNLDTFGDIAAEDDAVLDYFLTTSAVDEIRTGKVLVVLGRKGSGKTALVRHFTETEPKENGKPLSLLNYPWGAHQQLVDTGASANEAYVASWRLLISIRLASMVCELGIEEKTKSMQGLRSFLKNNFGNTDPEARSILTKGKLSVVGLTVGPQLFGISLGTITFGDPNRLNVLGSEINSLTSSILNDVRTVIRELNIKSLSLHFDELDQGLDKVDEVKAKMLTGLILAAREIRNSDKIGARICPVVYLRTDIWEQLRFSDKNKITQTSATVLNWNEKSLLDLVNIRISTRLGEGIKWDEIEDGAKMRGSQTKWNHILSRTLLRPRDVISFLNEALSTMKRRATGTHIFTNDDINNSRESYSTYLKNELDDEVIPHWEQWAEALQACSKSTTITFRGEDFVKNYKKIKSRNNTVEADEALEYLYRFSIIGYERRSSGGGSSWTFRYIDADTGWDRSAPRFKVHLGLKEFAKLKEERTN